MRERVHRHRLQDRCAVALECREIEAVAAQHTRHDRLRIESTDPLDAVVQRVFERHQATRMHLDLAAVLCGIDLDEVASARDEQRAASAHPLANEPLTALPALSQATE